MAAQLPAYKRRDGLDGGPATLHRSRTPLLAVGWNRSRSQPFQVCAVQRTVPSAPALLRITQPELALAVLTISAYAAPSASVLTK